MLNFLLDCFVIGLVFWLGYRMGERHEQDRPFRDAVRRLGAADAAARREREGREDHSEE